MIQKRLFVFKDDEQKLKELVAAAAPGKRLDVEYGKYVYILHRIIHSYIYTNERYIKHGRSMNVKEIQKIWGGSSSQLTTILRNLELWGYVKPFLPYIPGEQARTYKLTKEREGCQVSMKMFTRKTGGMLIKKLVNKVKEDLKTPIMERLYHVFQEHVSVSEEGLQFLQDKYRNRHLDALMQRYRNGDVTGMNEDFNLLMNEVQIDNEDFKLLAYILKDFYVKQPDVSKRMYSNLCNLKREYRQYILLQGKPMLQTDISNSQVTLSIPVINAALKEIHGDGYVSEDMKLYHTLATGGRFYEALAQEARFDISTEEARSEFKKSFYEQVFFSKVSKWNPKIKRAFKCMFPDAYTAIQHIKKSNHNQFAIQLQNLEAGVIIFDVLNQLQEEGHVVLPLHDALYCSNEETLQHSKVLIRESLRKKHNLEISFKDENRGVSAVDSKGPLTSVGTPTIKEVNCPDGAENGLLNVMSSPTVVRNLTSSHAHALQVGHAPEAMDLFQPAIRIFNEDQAILKLRQVFVDKVLETVTSNSTAIEMGYRLRSALAAENLPMQEVFGLNEWITRFQGTDIAPLIQSIHAYQAAA
jgi:DNA-binding transcriptional regulator GbsR (MarR family)